MTFLIIIQNSTDLLHITTRHRCDSIRVMEEIHFDSLLLRTDESQYQNISQAASNKYANDLARIYLFTPCEVGGSGKVSPMVASMVALALEV
jgi:hypothetical protein